MSFQKYPQRPQPRTVVRFRVNGGGVFVHTGLNERGYPSWYPADPDIMTNVYETLTRMVQFNKKF